MARNELPQSLLISAANAIRSVRCYLQEHYSPARSRKHHRAKERALNEIRLLKRAVNTGDSEAARKFLGQLQTTSLYLWAFEQYPEHFTDES